MGIAKDVCAKHRFTSGCTSLFRAFRLDAFTMSEKEIAEKRVIPYLEELGWPKQLITQYGKVPVQMGTDVKWADIVSMVVDENDLALPYLVVEVKTKLRDLNTILAQAESYSKFLDTIYFAITDGVKYLFYHRKPAGGYLRIGNIPVPDKDHLAVTQYTKFRPGFILCARTEIAAEESINQYKKEFLDKVDAYFNLMTSNKDYLGRGKRYTLKNDAIWHYLAIKKIKALVQKEVGSIRPTEFKVFFIENIMSEKQPNVNRTFAEVDGNFDKIKAFLRFVREFKGDPEKNLIRLFDRNDELHIGGMGPFIVSQFLAGAHPTEYAIVEHRMVNTMKEMGLIDARVKSNTARGYLYVNEICKRLRREVFEKKIEENRNKFTFEFDEDFELALIHEFFWEYEEFSCFNERELEETKDPKFEKQKLEFLRELGYFI